MALAKITIIGFNNYLSNLDDDLFKYLSVPDGIDKETLINNILLRGAEFEVLYSDPYFMQNMIGVWSNKWRRTMQRWINALSIEYNPLENYDRIENWADSASRKANTTANKNNVAHSVNADETTRNENAVAQDMSISTGNGETTNTRSAYESSNYQPHDKSTSETGGTNTSNGVTSAKGTTENKGTSSNINSENASSNDTQTSNGIHSGRTHGNIGVTTSQQMLEAELKISKWNIYEEITDLFLKEFCIYLY